MSLIPSSRRGSKVVFDPFFLNLWDPFKDFPFPSSSSLSAIPEFSRENSAFVSTRDVKVEVEDHRVLQISGERNVEEEDKNDKWHRVARSSGKFLRRFQLPENAKVDQIKAAIENGVLSVTILKAEVKKPDVKAIDISG
ncbi:18.5 kDa class I heat shock protein-like [Pyrus ussuriensis x Pyrus communis]|uniref:18.5 kDa class I heat shock protein-like n=1 Tax=Pyrus ussuriensis x Pyrus communis TaxID=2448454 RepID=A0A5N5G0T0_9ROSA|nr:18.5 kDa class I heat shock protein-like [Pyrus ussuriensis x Pyrus communis]